MKAFLIAATILSAVSGFAKAQDFNCYPLSVFAGEVTKGVIVVEVFYGADAQHFVDQFNHVPPASSMSGDIAVLFEFDHVIAAKANTMVFIGHRLSNGDYEFCGHYSFMSRRVLFHQPLVGLFERKTSL